MISGADYCKELLDQKIAGSEPYDVTFAMGQAKAAPHSPEKIVRKGKLPAPKKVGAPSTSAENEAVETASPEPNTKAKNKGKKPRCFAVGESVVHPERGEGVVHQIKAMENNKEFVVVVLF